MPLNDTDEIPVLVTDLRLFIRAFNAAYGSVAAWDLLEQYRQMAERPHKSNLQKALTTAHDRAQGYITEAEKRDNNLIESGEEDDDGE